MRQPLALPAVVAGLTCAQRAGRHVLMLDYIIHHVRFLVLYHAKLYYDALKSVFL